MEKKYKLFNDLDYGYQIQEALYVNKYSLGLDRFMNQMLSAEEYEKIKDDRKKQFDITLKYLSALLRSGELKMKTFELFEKSDPDGFEGKVFSFHNGREWKQEEIEQGIEYVRKKWDSIDTEREEYLKTGE